MTGNFKSQFYFMNQLIFKMNDSIYTDDSSFFYSRNFINCVKKENKLNFKT